MEKEMEPYFAEVRTISAIWSRAKVVQDTGGILVVEFMKQTKNAFSLVREVVLNAELVSVRRYQS